jgi:histidinol phosphatase-like PHP family hydrolase
MKLRQDLHIHTFRSACGQESNTVAAIAAALDEAGFLLGGICDHIDSPLQRESFAEMLAANRADRIGAPGTCTLLVGAEATMLSHRECALDADLAARADYVMVACNHYHLPGVEKPSSWTPHALAEHHCGMIEAALDLPFATAVCHPFFNTYCPEVLARETMRWYPEARIRELLAKAAARGVAFEINPYRIGPVTGWFRDFVSEARRQGARFLLGSDAHSLAPVGFPDGPLARTPGQVCEAVGLVPADLAWPFTKGPDRG